MSTLNYGRALSASDAMKSRSNMIGLEGIRICNSSIMSGLIGSNTNAPTIMIGEKASDLTRGNQ